MDLCIDWDGEKFLFRPFDETMMFEPDTVSQVNYLVTHYGILCFEHNLESSEISVSVDTLAEDYDHDFVADLLSTNLRDRLNPKSYWA
jgi:hypothetical protein